MEDDRISKLAFQLGYEKAELLPTGGAGSAVSLRCQTGQGTDHVVKLWRASSSDAGRSKSAGHAVYGTASYQTYLYSTGVTTNPVEDIDSKILGNSLLRWEVGEKSDGKATNRILSYGIVSGYIYECRNYYPMTLSALLDRQVLPNHSILGTIVDQLWSALAFLHSTEINTPHGSLHPGNIGISSKSIADAKYTLLDISETSETRRLEFKRRDYQYLGNLIYRLCNSELDHVDPVDAIVRCKNASWPHLGKYEQKWKSLVQLLLDANSLHSDWNSSQARMQHMSALLGATTSLTTFASGRNVTVEPPFYVHGDAEQSIQEDVSYLDDAKEAWAQGNVLAAFHFLKDCPREHKEKEACIMLADEYAAELADEWAGISELMLCIEALADAGSVQCMFLLGRFLAKTEPAEALQWLQKAASYGYVTAKLIMAGIYENGGEMVPSDPVKAAVLYEEYIQEPGCRESEIIYRLASLILREAPLEKDLPSAIRLLAEAHNAGHFKSTDLLAQCHAQGHGTEVNEKKAFQLFADAWSRSKKAGQEYYTASNNLGVCFAIGFGVKKGLTMARHYFRQGEGAGHEASKKNLLSLAQLG
jgi:TPR repeat protein